MDPRLERPLRDLPWAVLVGAGLGVGLRFTGLSNHLGYSLAICLTFSVVMWGGFDLLQPWYEPSDDPALPPARAASISMLKVSLLYLGLLLLCWGLVWAITGINLMARPVVGIVTFLIGFALTNFMMAKHTLVHLVEKERALAREAARASFLGLQAQLQPHTLFNSLNTIAALIPGEPARAEEATLRLSALLRRILGALEQPLWPLREEFNLLEDLLALEGLRFEGRLTARLDLEPAMMERPVPPLLLLPLVENSLKHGFRPKVGACAMSVVAADRRVTVRDDGVGRDPEAPEGVGLRTVRERLEAHGGALAWLDTGQGCAVEVRLP